MVSKNHQPVYVQAGDWSRWSSCGRGSKNTPPLGRKPCRAVLRLAIGFKPSEGSWLRRQPQPQRATRPATSENAQRKPWQRNNIPQPLPLSVLRSCCLITFSPKVRHAFPFAFSFCPLPLRCHFILHLLSSFPSLLEYTARLLCSYRRAVCRNGSQVRSPSVPFIRKPRTEANSGTDFLWNITG